MTPSIRLYPWTIEQGECVVDYDNVPWKIDSLDDSALHDIIARMVAHAPGIYETFHDQTSCACGRDLTDCWATPVEWIERTPLLLALRQRARGSGPCLADLVLWQGLIDQDADAADRWARSMEARRSRLRKQHQRGRKAARGSEGSSGDGNPSVERDDEQPDDD